MSGHLYYGILAAHAPQGMSVSVPCDSSQILEGKDSKYGVTVCLWYDRPEKKDLLWAARDGSFLYKSR